ncbi:FUSC family protein [Rhodoferax sp.]|uniref:FUSC family protein n=1 Tax=Rhodoferax sp. TaxID=50421 RepID=UPI002849EB7A|nr:FUSC family protein [Rhodoferax sp.]MDR3369502.1 FUSC family protein [Rhodoferax sp.]
MMNGRNWRDVVALVQTEIRHLTAINTSDRRWAMPFCAALATGLPLLLGAYWKHLNFGLVSSLGGLVFVYTPKTPLSHRMVVLMACAFGMSACFALGVMTHFWPLLLVPVLTFIAILVTMVCRFYAVGPPGSLFFIMAAAIGAYAPGELLQMPQSVGLLTLGALLACLIAFFYSLYHLRQQAAEPVRPLPPASFDFVIYDSVVIGGFVGLSLVVAQVLHMERAYWVPMSCMAVMQGATLRAVWHKQVQRIVGTAVGLLLAWALLQLVLDPWRVALLMMTLTFCIEVLIVRHYGLAVIFITPLTIFLAEAAYLGQGSSTVMLQARLWDSVLGSVVGLLGGVFLHSPRLRASLGRWLRQLAPARSRG